MNKDEAREAAISELHAKQFVEGRDLRFYGAGFDKGFDAGAASVDRRAIVEEAFENLLDRFIGRDFYGYDDIADVMNEALAEMEANNENSKM